MAAASQESGSPTGLDALVRVAYAARAALHADPEQTAYRLFHGHGEGLPGLDVDRFGPVWLISHSAEHEPSITRIADRLLTLDPDTTCVVARWRGRGGPEVVRGSLPPTPLVVRDNGLRFEVDPLAPRSPGLYLDARPARQWLRTNAAGRRVLNLFAWTGSLGIAAAAGGAQWVLHVELQKRALRRLKRNLVLNGLRADDRDLLQEDLYRLLPRLLREGRSFDGIILDPPPQVPNRPEGQDYPTLVPLVTPLLSPGGWLLCFFSRRGRARDVYEQEIRAASEDSLDVIARGTSGEDFPEADPEDRLRFTVFERRA